MNFRRTLLLSLLCVFVASASFAQEGIDDSSMLRLHVLFTSDIHGYIGSFPATWMNPDFPPPIGGGASAATYIKKVRERLAGDPNAAVLLLDGGDCWQGSPVGTITEGSVMVDFYNTLGYDLVAVGNHEFDAGWQNARELSQGLAKPMVSCNILDAKTGELVDWVQPYRIFERDGLKIGVIGAITVGVEHMAFKENIEGLMFAPIAPSVEKYRDILKEEKGVDLVLLVVHDGLPHVSQLESEWARVQAESAKGGDMRENAQGALELAHVIEGIPAMFGGDTHQGYQEPWIDPYTHTLFFEPFARGTAVGHAILLVDRETGEVTGYELPRRDGALVSLFEDQFWPDQEMSDALEPWITAVNAQLGEVVGRSETPLLRAGKSNNAMGNFVSEAMRSTFDADFAFTNAGGLRTDLRRGDITLGDIQELLPFGNAMVVAEMDGRMIRRIVDRKSSRRSGGMYQSGLKIVVDPDAESGERVLSCLVGGAPLQPDKIYRVVTTDYLMDGNSGFDFLTTLPAAAISYTQILTRDGVVRYLRQNSPVRPRADDRYREEPDGEMESYLRNWGPSESR